jgi:hypothetical protein
MMATQFEWAHATDGPGLLDPEELAEFADDGNVDGDWGLAFSTGSNGCMIFGSPMELEALARRILDVLPGEAPGGDPDLAAAE